MNLDGDLEDIDLPERHDDDDDGDDWKVKPMRDAARPLMKLAMQIIKTTQAIVETIPDDNEMMAHHKSWMMENAFKLGPKIAGAVGSESYMIMMENAVIIKVNARELRTQCMGLEMFDYEHPEYLDTLRSEIDAFQKQFVVWVRTFRKEDDMHPDGWGLFYTEEDVERYNKLNPDEPIEE